MRVGYLWLPDRVETTPLRFPNHAGGKPPCYSYLSPPLSEGEGEGVLASVPSSSTLFERALDLLDRFAEALEVDAARGVWFIPAGPLPRPSDARRLGAAIVDGLAATLGLDTHIAITPGKLSARIAADRAGSGEVIVLTTDDTAAYLAPLPVTLLPLPPETIDRLNLLGISTVDQFARLPAPSLSRRFGRDALRAHRLARGRDSIDEEPLIPRQHPEVRQLRHAIEPPIDDRAVVFAVALALLDALCQSLQSKGQAFRALWITAELEDGAPAEQDASLREPTSDPARCRALLRSMVDALALSQPVAAMIVRVGAIGRSPVGQGELFDHLQAERRKHVDQALAEISRRYQGRLRRIVPSANPSSLFDERRLLLLPGPAGAPPNLTSPDPAEPAQRLRPIHLVSRAGRIYLREENNRRDEIIALHNRWEADDWWPDSVRRTYYRVRTSRGLILTLARDHTTQSWLLAERFD